MPWNISVIAKSAPPQIEIFERAGLLERARVPFKLLPLVIGFGLAAAFSLVHGTKFRKQQWHRYKFVRRKIAGGVSGYLCAALSSSTSIWIKLTYAEIGAAWSTLLIATDAAIDDGQLARADANMFLRSVFDEIYSRTRDIIHPETSVRLFAAYTHTFTSGIDEPMVPPPEKREIADLQELARSMGERIAQRILRLHRWHLNFGNADKFSTGVAMFHSRLIKLAQGQMSSLEQRIIDEQHDWFWYQHVIDMKFENVLKAPLALIIAEDDVQRELFERCLNAINRRFYHRQVLDDLLDFEEDLSNRSANALLYILFSQGLIAERWKRDCSDHCVVARDAFEFRLGPLPKIDPSEAATEHIIRVTLANRPSEIDMPIAALMYLCIARAGRILRAWKDGDCEALRTIVVESGIAGRVLSTIGTGEMEPDCSRMVAELRSADLFDVLRAYYNRTMDTFDRCRERWA